MSKYKSILYMFLVTTIGFALFHFVLLFTCSEALYTQSLALILVPYGFPILMAAIAWNEACKDRKVWRKASVFMAVLFALSYLAMTGHVTIAFVIQKDSYMNIYFNVPLWYIVPMLVFAILWGITKKNPMIEVRTQKKTIVGKVISVLPILLLIAMVVHIAIVAVIEIIRQINAPLSTSAPWWIMPFVIALVYIAVIAVALLLRGIYNFVQRHKNS